MTIKFTILKLSVIRTTVHHRTAYKCFQRANVAVTRKLVKNKFETEFIKTFAN